MQEDVDRAGDAARDQAQHLVEEERGGGGLGHVEDTGQLLAAAVLLLEEAGVVHRHRHAVGQRLQGGDVAGVERAGVAAADVEDAEEAVAEDDRQGQFGAGAFDRGGRQEPRVRRDVVDQQGLAGGGDLADDVRAAGNAQAEVVGAGVAGGLRLQDQLVAPRLVEQDADVVVVEDRADGVGDAREEVVGLADRDDAAAHLVERAELVGAALLAGVGAGVLQRHRAAAGDRAEQGHVLVGVALAVAGDDDRADGAVAGDHRHAEPGQRAGAVEAGEPSRPRRAHSAQ